MHTESSPPLAGRKVLVTGGNGFIGSVVVRKLVEAGAQVRCLLRPTSRTARIDGLPFERAEGDVRDGEAVRRAAEGCQGIIHTAGLSAMHLVDTPEAAEIGLKGTRNVLDAARAGGVERVVYTSSLTAVNASDEPKIFDETAPFELAGKGLRYAEHKNAAERLCLEYDAGGVPVVIVNPAETYGPNDIDLITSKNLIDAINMSPLVLWEGGTSVVHVDDVALGIVRALERGRPGERYILGGDNLTIRQAGELVCELARVKKTIVMVPRAVLRGAAKGAAALRLPFPMTPATVLYATRYWFADNGKARRELGVTFRSARDCFAPTLAWLKEAGHIK